MNDFDRIEATVAVSQIVEEASEGAEDEVVFAADCLAFICSQHNINPESVMDRVRESFDTYLLAKVAAQNGGIQ